MNNAFVNRFFLCFMKLILCTTFFIIYVEASEIKDFQLLEGIKISNVENHNIPIVNMKFSFSGGYFQDPVGKEGLVKLLCRMLKKNKNYVGVKDLYGKIDEISLLLNLEAENNRIHGSIRIPRHNMNQAINIISEIIQEPCFDQYFLDYSRDLMINELSYIENDPISRGKSIFYKKILGSDSDDGFGNGTVKSLKSITISDLQSVYKNLFAKDNLNVNFVGDISSEEAKIFSYKIFNKLPKKSVLRKINKHQLHFGDKTFVQYNGIDSKIYILYPFFNKKKNHSQREYYAYQIVGHILNSRMFQKIRDEQGLTYFIIAYPISLYSIPVIKIKTFTHFSNLDKITNAIFKEIDRTFKNEFSQKEVDVSKNFILSLNAGDYSSSFELNSLLLDMQENGISKEYLEERAKIVKSITLKEVNDVCKEILSNEPSVLTLGIEKKSSK